MKVENFKNLIKEAVREVLKEELTSITRSLHENINGNENTVFSEKRKNNIPNINPVVRMLEETKNSMTREDFRNINNSPPALNESINFTSNSIEDHPGLDISNLSFVKNASKIYKKSLEISNKNGV